MKNKMFKLAAAMAMVLAAGSASAEYLYSMIDGAYYYYNGEKVNFKYATIKGVYEDNYSYLYFYQPDQTSSTATKLGAGQNTYYDVLTATYTNDGNMRGTSTGAAYAKLEEQVAYSSFVFELWGLAGERLAWKTYEWDAVQGYIAGSTSQTGASPLRVTEVVPEPTGGLLMLLGMAMVALRRRRSC